ncbi:hypothetical protein FNH09_22310 [Streptomyces adustus]|uniref:Uncharacterized protein n=1 Tax=Streptomyces adustus TaxID=1609272 RepID=A0A5N8VGT3_9ACTN|nr:hypothetical protein [Streptomyces adustus]MPY33872.1 hypothetical protein [Streptomyces adustus]
MAPFWKTRLQENSCAARAEQLEERIAIALLLSPQRPPDVTTGEALTAQDLLNLELILKVIVHTRPRVYINKYAVYTLGQSTQGDIANSRSTRVEGARLPLKHETAVYLDSYSSNIANIP